MQSSIMDFNCKCYLLVIAPNRLTQNWFPHSAEVYEMCLSWDQNEKWNRKEM